MPDQVQLRGGSQQDNDSFTGAQREVTVDTTNKTLRVHDGVAAGGSKLAAFDEWGRLQVADPQDAQDATSKSYVDGAIADSRSIVQTVFATSVAHDSTTLNTFQATSLSGSITPQYADSIIMVTCCVLTRVTRVAGTTLERSGSQRIRNTTDGVDIEGAENVEVGRLLIGASDQAALSRVGGMLGGRYVVDSVAERTFELQHKVFTATNTEISLAGASSTALMILQEVRP